MRADRLVSVLLLLQARGRVTAAEVADELEISVRTARRDLEALSMAGIPVYSQAGRGGGWSLVGGARTDLTGLTRDEARALLVSAETAWTAGPELASALRKLVAALPAPFQPVGATVSSSIMVDPSSWGQAPARRPEHLDALQVAVLEQRQVHLGYRTPNKGASRRTVHPWGLVAKGTLWYLLAGTDDGERLFRVDRVTAVEPTDEPSVRPEGFDLADLWRQVSAHIEGYRARVRARARVDPHWIGLVRAVHRERLTEYGVDEDGWHQVEIGGQAPREIAAVVAGFGDAVRVEEPPEVIDELAQLGRELTQRYGAARS